MESGLLCLLKHKQRWSSLWSHSFWIEAEMKWDQFMMATDAFCFFFLCLDWVLIHTHTHDPSPTHYSLCWHFLISSGPVINLPSAGISPICAWKLLSVCACSKVLYVYLSSFCCCHNFSRLIWCVYVRVALCVFNLLVNSWWIWKEFHRCR